MEQCCRSEPRAVESEASLPVPLRHLRDLQKLFAVRGSLVKHKWIPAVQTGTECSLPPSMACGPWGSWLGWQDVSCHSIPGRHTGSGVVKGHQCFPPLSHLWQRCCLVSKLTAFSPHRGKKFFYHPWFFSFKYIFFEPWKQITFYVTQEESLSLPHCPKDPLWKHSSIAPLQAQAHSCPDARFLQGLPLHIPGLQLGSSAHVFFKIYLGIIFPGNILMPFSRLKRKSKQQHRPEAKCLSRENGTCFVPKYL